MEKTVVGIFDSRESAEEAANQIKNQGLRLDDISIVAKDQNTTATDTDGELVNDNISDGVTAGAVIGGLAGLLIGVGTFAIPGLGMLVAAGPLAGLLSGAVTGGVVGGLVDLGIPEAEGKRYEEEIRRGRILLTMRSTEESVDDVAGVLRNSGAFDVKVY